MKSLLTAFERACAKRDKAAAKLDRRQAACEKLGIELALAEQRAHEMHIVAPVAMDKTNAPQASAPVARLRRLQQLRPNYSEMGRQLGVTPAHVRRVFLGIGTSARVMDAIEADIRQKMRKPRVSA